MPSLGTLIRVASVMPNAAVFGHGPRRSHVSMVERVVVTEAPWAQSTGTMAAYLHANAESTGELGHCGLEVQHCTKDGIMDEEDPACRPRPILSGTLFVAKRHRRKGIAQRLLRESERLARRWGYGEMLLLVERKNRSALHLYEKMGYSPVGAPKKEHGTQICLRRELYSPNMHTLHSMLPQKTIL